jgi:esterase/lipase superfamily enzyme
VQWPTSLPGDAQQNFITVSANYRDKKNPLPPAAKQTRRGKVLVFVHGLNTGSMRRSIGLPKSFMIPKPPLFRSYSPGRRAALWGCAPIRTILKTQTTLATLLSNCSTRLGPMHNVKEVKVVCHSMGCFLTLEALQSKALRAGKIGDKVKNVLLVAPDVDVNLFRTQMRQMGSARPRFALFISQDDHALKLSRSISGGVTRLGDVDPDQEPYKSDFQRERIMVFDLTGLRDVRTRERSKRLPRSWA